jgi:phage tail-like protein
MAVGDRVDPYRGFNFKLELGTDAVAGFRECSGLSFTNDPVEYREGTDPPRHVRLLTGLAKKARISLKRGMTQNKDLFTWYKTVLDGAVERRDGAIVLQDEQHNPVMRWNFENGWICKWEGPMMNATSNDVALESIEICVEDVLLAPTA